MNKKTLHTLLLGFQAYAPVDELLFEVTYKEKKYWFLDLLQEAIETLEDGGAVDDMVAALFPNF